MTGGCWTIFERYLAMTSSRIPSLLTANGVAPFVPSTKDRNSIGLPLQTIGDKAWVGR
jgi:hypothetical protein